MSKVQKDDKFIQGYVCAICAYISARGADTSIAEVYQSGVGNMSLKQLKEAGVDRYDIYILENNWAILVGIK